MGMKKPSALRSHRLRYLKEARLSDRDNRLQANQPVFRFHLNGTRRQYNSFGQAVLLKLSRRRDHNRLPMRISYEKPPHPLPLILRCKSLHQLRYPFIYPPIAADLAGGHAAVGVFNLSPPLYQKSWYPSTEKALPKQSLPNEVVPSTEMEQ